MPKPNHQLVSDQSARRPLAVGAEPWGRIRLASLGRAASRLSRPIFAAAGIWVAVIFAIYLHPDGAFLVYGVVGSGLIVLAAYPTRLTAGVLLVGGCLVYLLRLWGSTTSLPTFVEQPAFVVANCGVAAIFFLGLHALREPVRPEVALGVLGIPIFILLTVPFHALVIHLTPRTLDPVLHRIDVAVFGDATFAAARALALHPWLRAAGLWSYDALALMGSAVYALALRGATGKVRPAEVLWGLAAAGVIGPLFYVVIPAVGPSWVFPEWPWRLPEVQASYAFPPEVPRNAMPSLHAAWALLVWWNGREGPMWLRYLLAPWLALTLLATVGLGGHYLIDLVGSLPLTWAAAWIGLRMANRRAEAGVSEEAHVSGTAAVSGTGRR